MDGAPLDESRNPAEAGSPPVPPALAGALARAVREAEGAYRPADGDR
ncbi:hypothetical protein [Catenuloplanes atrovinosus]|uniref:Uncharacterized protein n=1 Tax=Catenuloplanes atrovinosus TaxID=137266 RepID=A0AAE4CAQ2_9ACTN|nr:hypothetical protein [Catenuloplanes atrovinosus]MDR7277288.1 hypothetical protein [Catenuloplanes atrovinosus]